MPQPVQDNSYVVFNVLRQSAEYSITITQYRI